jgi:Cu/Ag efflux protein CusF
MTSAPLLLRTLGLAAGLLWLLPSAACARQEGGGQGSQTASSASSPPVIRQAKGVIKSVAGDRSNVKIKHEEIPGYMAAMTMPFLVEQASLLEGLQAGDAVEFSFHEKDGEAVLDTLKKVAPAQP